MTISIASAFQTTDGKSFPTRKEAEAHQSKLARVAKLTALFATGDVEADEAGLVTIEDIADKADAVTAALHNPLGKGKTGPRGPRKPKAPADAPAA